MKYSNSFKRDIGFYLQNRKNFNFDGGKSEGLIIKKDLKGVDGIYAFFKYDSEGKLLPTKHPNLFKSLITSKGSVNLHIKMWAEDRANGRLPLMLFSSRLAKENHPYPSTITGKDLETEFNLPEWVVNAVEQQKVKYY